MPTTVAANSFPHLYEAFRLLENDTNPLGCRFSSVSVPDTYSADDVNVANDSLSGLRGKSFADLGITPTEDVSESEDLLYEFCCGEQTNIERIVESDPRLVATNQLLNDFFDGWNSARD